MAEESTSEQLLKDAVKSCFCNAEQFIEDAELLFDNGSYGHAFALAVLGEEELAKGLTYYAYSEGILPKDFLKEVGVTRDSHMMKLSIGFGLARAYKQFVLKETVGDISSEKVKERILQLKKNKEKGLYVDLDLEKKVLSSPKSLKKDEVEKYLSELKAIYEAAKPRLALPVSLTQPERKRVKTFMKELITLMK